MMARLAVQEGVGILNGQKPAPPSNCCPRSSSRVTTSPSTRDGPRTARNSPLALSSAAPCRQRLDAALRAALIDGLATLDEPSFVTPPMQPTNRVPRISPRLAAQYALATGASQGIGRATAIRFAQEGATVAINFLDHRADAEDTPRPLSSREAACARASVSSASAR